MTNAVDQLKSQAMRLSATERADLASFLLDSLGPDAADEEAWRAEIARRVAAVRSGEATGRPLDDVLAELRGTYPSLRRVCAPSAGVA